MLIGGVNVDYRTAEDMFDTCKDLLEKEDKDGLLKETKNLVGTLISTLLTVNRKWSSRGNDLLFLNILLNVSKVYTYELDAPMAVGFRNLGVSLYVNPERLIGFTENADQVLVIITHECYHLIFEHLTEFDWVFSDQVKRNAMNIATDCHINQRLDNLPKGVVTLDYVNKMVGKKLDKLAGSMYYYEEIIDNVDPDKLKGLGEGSISMDSHDTWEETDGDGGGGMSSSSKINKIVAHQVIGNLIKDAYNNVPTKERGTIAGSITSVLERFNEKKKINWKSLFKRGLGSIPVPYKLTKKRLNRRFPERLMLSGRISDRVCDVIVFLDTSLSMSDDVVKYALSEVFHIIKDWGINSVTLVQIDTEVQSVSKVSVKDLNSFTVNGRGGTSFQPAFDWLRDNKFTNKNSISVYFTDGFGESKVDNKGYNNMHWVLCNNDSKKEDLSCDGGNKVALLRDDNKYARKFM